ncbi:sugar ABC transporter permease [Spirochaetia bacterium]|nr:sugar ABC transporter permease [Spirochaetia bacterium]
MQAKRFSPLSILAILLGALVILVMLTPYIWMLLQSFKTTREILRNPGKILPIQWTLNSYRTVLTKSPFFSWFRNSVIVTGSVTILVIFTSTIAGFVFSKFKFPLRNIIFWILMASMMVPSQAVMIPQFLIVNTLGLYNSLFALIIPGSVSLFGIFLCRQFCAGIPDSLWEAAVIDGASSFIIYTRVMVPLLRPCIATLAIFTFLSSWNEFLRALIYLESVKNMTLPIAISYFANGVYSIDFAACLAASALIMIPVTIVFLVLQKQFIKGVAISGMK